MAERSDILIGGEPINADTIGLDKRVCPRKKKQYIIIGAISVAIVILVVIIATSGKSTTLTSFDISRFKTPKVENMTSMFRNLLDVVSGFDTSKVTDFSYIFQNCETLESLDLSKFNNTKKSTSFDYMFAGGTSLTSLDISSFESPEVTHMFGMFSGDKVLKTIDVSKFDTSKTIDMGSMFQDCAEKTKIGYENFDISQPPPKNNYGTYGRPFPPKRPNVVVKATKKVFGLFESIVLLAIALVVIYIIVRFKAIKKHSSYSKSKIPLYRDLTQEEKFMLHYS